MKKSSNTARFGIVTILLGLFLFAGIINLFDESSLLSQYWPVLLMAASFVLIGDPDNRWIGAGLLGISFLMLLRRLGAFSSGIGEILIAVAIIFIGIFFIMLAGDKFSKPTE